MIPESVPAQQYQPSPTAPAKSPSERLAAFGGQAFPCDRRDGMTLLDYFAGQVVAQLMRQVVDAGPLNGRGFSNADIAAEAYSVAAAMVAERTRLGVRV